MKLLIIGGTVFLGRHIVTECLKRGHDVTLFNRGQSNAELFEGEVKKITGDRESDLSKLEGLQFDACIDPSAYLPGQVSSAANYLSAMIETYVFISSISVYSAFTKDMDESSPLSVLPEDSDSDTFVTDNYGALKALCEKAAEEAMPGRVLQVRSGLIVGPYDPTNRFTYWPVRVSQGGDMLAPGRPDLPIQFIDARDQANWILDMIENKQRGTFNVNNPSEAYTLLDLIESGARVAGNEINPIWVDSDFLVKEGVAPWMGLPLWLPEDMLDMSKVSPKKAIEMGLSIRPIDETVRDTLEWYGSIPEQDWPAGITPEKEADVLSKWKSSKINPNLLNEGPS